MEDHIHRYCKMLKVSCFSLLLSSPCLPPCILTSLAPDVTCDSSLFIRHPYWVSCSIAFAIPPFPQPSLTVISTPIGFLPKPKNQFHWILCFFPFPLFHPICCHLHMHSPSSRSMAPTLMRHSVTTYPTLACCHLCIHSFRDISALSI